VNDLEVIAATLGGLAALVILAGLIAIWAGMLAGSVSLRIVPREKRKPQQQGTP
jgi:hypothetical protein